MEWSPQQEAALLAVRRWLDDPGRRQVFRLFGYAGTGKTTLAKHLAEGVDGEVFFGAYTGKAAHVLRQKGCRGATTIHSMIYHTREKSRLRMKQLEGELVALMGAEATPRVLARMQQIKEELDREKNQLSQPVFTLNMDAPIKNAALIVIDECSMVDGKMGGDLLFFERPVLVLGDPAQLPPVGGGGFFTEHEPDILLTDIHRQARDNPILSLATMVREGGRPQLGSYGESRVIMKKDVTPEMAMEADQIIVGRNATRRASNRRARQLLGMDHPHPIPDDRIICLRNNHDLGLMNGAIFEVLGVGGVDEENIIMDIQSVDDELSTLSGVLCHMHYFQDREDKLAWWERNSAEEFDYGYAITCHKAQGSQFDDVFMFDESWCFRKDAQRWLYTAITRAAKRITIVKT